MKRFICGMLAAQLLALCGATIAYGQATTPAQERQERREERREDRREGTGQVQVQPGERVVGQPGERIVGQSFATTADAHFIYALSLSNKNEIEIAKLAAQRAQSDEVKQYASQLIKDHTALQEKLVDFHARMSGQAPAGAQDQGQARPEGQAQPEGQAADQAQPRTLPASQQEPAPRQPAQVEVQAQPGQAGVRVQGQPRQEVGPGARQPETQVQVQSQVQDQGRTSSLPFDLNAIQKEMAAQCLESARQELTGKEGAEFDACFIGMAIGQHGHMKDAITVFERHSSPQLQELLADAKGTVEEHLQKAKELMPRVAKKAFGQSASSREETSTRSESK